MREWSQDTHSVRLAGETICASPRSADGVGEERSIGADRNRFARSTKRKTFLGDRFEGESTMPDTMGAVSTSIDNAFAVRRPRRCSRASKMLVGWGAVTMKKSAM